MLKIQTFQSIADSIKKETECEHEYIYKVIGLTDKNFKDIKTGLGYFKNRNDAIKKAIEFTGCEDYDWNEEEFDDGPNASFINPLIEYTNKHGPELELVRGPAESIISDCACAAVRRVKLIH